VKRALALLPLIVLAGLLAVLGWFNFHKKPTYEPREMIGKSVPTQALADLDDGSLRNLRTLAASYNRPIVVNIFASWCVPCIAENPQLLALKDKGVPIIGIAWKDQPQDTRNFLNQHENPYVRTLSDPDARIGVQMGITGVPETFIVMPDGTITDKVAGPIVPQSVDSVYRAATRDGKIQ
jgi:cytochrome c biogenesis protein CcmG, thiol:disulfide interchange protein DsbE